MGDKRELSDGRLARAFLPLIGDWTIFSKTENEILQFLRFFFKNGSYSQKNFKCTSATLK